MSTTAPLPLPVVSPEVQSFAEQRRVTEYLPAVLEMTRRIFPGAPMRVFVEDDPELADDRHIVLEVAVPDSDMDQLLVARRQWVEDVFGHCPATHVCVFRLGMVSRL